MVLLGDGHDRASQVGVVLASLQDSSPAQIADHQGHLWSSADPARRAAEDGLGIGQLQSVAAVSRPNRGDHAGSLLGSTDNVVEDLDLHGSVWRAV